jgi:hypothetical protein
MISNIMLYKFKIMKVVYFLYKNFANYNYPDGTSI